MAISSPTMTVMTPPVSDRGVAQYSFNDVAIAGERLSNQDAEFESAWASLAPRLKKALACRGIPGDAIDDVVQETAARLWERWAALDRSSPLWNLALTIALRLGYDDSRRRQRLQLMPEPPSTRPEDGEERALQRAQLREAAHQIGTLPTHFQAVLLEQLGEAESSLGPAARIAVVRFRARQALRERLGPWAPSAIGVRVRELFARIEAHLIATAPSWSSGVSTLIAASIIVGAGATSSAAVTAASATGLPASAPTRRAIDPTHKTGALIHSPSDNTRTVDQKDLMTRRGREVARPSQAEHPVHDASDAVKDQYNDTADEVRNRHSDAVHQYNGAVKEMRRANRRARKRIHRTWQKIEQTYHEVTPGENP